MVLGSLQGFQKQEWTHQAAASPPPFQTLLLSSRGSSVEPLGFP